MSLKRALNLTRAPASLQTRAITLSIGPARFFRRPVWGACCSVAPKLIEWLTASSAMVSGNGSRSRSNKSTLNRCGGIVNSGAVGACDRAAPALRPE